MPDPNDEHERGAIYNRRLAGQLLDYTGLQYGRPGREKTITPMDIDGFEDFGERLFVLMEAKLKRVPLRGGQRLAFQRKVDNVSDKVHSLGIVCEHVNREGDIDMAACMVREYRWLRQWRTPPKPVTVRQLIDATLKYLKLDYE
jgi:hypothetical protein